MKINEIEDYDEALIHREMLKIYLDTFSMSFENVADQALDKAINLQREWYKKHLNDLISLSIRNNKSEEEQINSEFDKYYTQLYLSADQDIAFALFELKIMYAYKYFEIRLKELSKSTFRSWPCKKRMTWDKIGAFYKKEHIIFSELANFDEVDQLREMNNSLKHHKGVLEDKIGDIPEFKGLSYIQVGQLKKFYERVQEAPKVFISALASAIYDQLFKDDISMDISNEFDIQDNELILPF